MMKAVDGGTIRADASPDLDAPSVTPSVVVFSKTAGFRHGSIASGISLVESLGAENGWSVTATEDSDELIAALASANVVVFCNTTGDILTDAQQDSFEAFIRGGGGYVGIHSATDTEYGWPFYSELVGTLFENHPSPQVATVELEAAGHPATEGWPASFDINEEWYNFRSNPRAVAGVSVLATLDEGSYSGGEMGDDHPIMWTVEIGEGRAFYTALGHRDETYANTEFVTSIRGGIEWAAQP